VTRAGIKGWLCGGDESDSAAILVGDLVMYEAVYMVGGRG
jgi:hypothetical protein